MNTKKHSLIFSCCTLASLSFLLTSCSENKKPVQSEGKTTQTSNTKGTTMGKITLPSKLQYEIIQEAPAGAREAKKGDTVIVHYTGWLATGSKDRPFDSSHKRNQPFSFKLGAGYVIRGWDEGVDGMKIGETRILHIPSNLGYGARGAGASIPGNADLVFEVTLLGIQ